MEILMRADLDALFPMMAAAVVAAVLCIPHTGLWGLVGVGLAIHVVLKMFG